MISLTRMPFFASLMRLYPAVLKIEWLGKKTRLLCEPELIEQDINFNTLLFYSNRNVYLSSEQVIVLLSGMASLTSFTQTLQFNLLAQGSLRP